VPGLPTETVDPDTPHTFGVPDVKVTGKPELAVAETKKEPGTSWLPGDGKLMD
jgi:hypothetical protein